MSDARWVRRIVAVLLAVLALPACASAYAPDDQAVTYQGNPAHSGVVSGAGINGTLTQAWCTASDGSSYPLIANGRVFVLDYSSGGTLEAHDQATGALLWQQDMPAYWTGMTYDRGRVLLTRNNGALRAIDAASGTVLWTRVYSNFNSPASAPVATHGLVYFVISRQDDYSTLYAARDRD